MQDSLQAVIKPASDTQHNAACVTMIATASATNIFRSRARTLASNASANTPPTNVNRNGNAHNQGALVTCVVYTNTRASTINSGAVFPKYLLLRLVT